MIRPPVMNLSGRSALSFFGKVLLYGCKEELVVLKKRANHGLVITVWIEEEKWKQIDSVISSGQLMGIGGKCNFASFHIDL